MLFGVGVAPALTDAMLQNRSFSEKTLLSSLCSDLQTLLNQGCLGFESRRNCGMLADGLTQQQRMPSTQHKPDRVRTVVTGRGVRILQNGVVLSEVLAKPGPTHSVFDVLAAAVCCHSNGSRLALLGFEGGGILGPLRALGSVHSIAAVDVSDRSYGVFQRLCGSWCGRVEFHHRDAEAWLRGTRSRFDAIIEDISLAAGRRVFQPDMVWHTLPRLVRARLRPSGIAVFNLLKPEVTSLKSVVREIACHFSGAYMIEFDDFENRILVAGVNRGATRSASHRIRTLLAILGSRLASRISVGTVGG